MPETDAHPPMHQRLSSQTLTPIFSELHVTARPLHSNMLVGLVVRLPSVNLHIQTPLALRCHKHFSKHLPTPHIDVCFLSNLLERVLPVADDPSLQHLWLIVVQLRKDGCRLVSICLDDAELWYLEITARDKLVPLVPYQWLLYSCFMYRLGVGVGVGSAGSRVCALSLADVD